MERIAFGDRAKEIVVELEITLGKLALAAESGISTNSLEDKAKKLAAKVRASGELFGNIDMYKDVKITSQIYSWTIADKLPDELFPRYATLCRKLKDTPDIYEDDKQYFAQVGNNLFVSLQDLPEAELPKFKVKLEGDTLIAVKSSMFTKLPKEIQKLIQKGGNEDGE